MNRGSESAVATGMAGLGLLIPASLGLLVSGVPTIWCPFPILTILPSFLLAEHEHGLWKVAVAVPMLCFFAWHPGLFRGESRVPKRSYVLLMITALLSVVYFVTSWELGSRYQGLLFTREVCAANVAWVGFLGLAFARAWKQPFSFKYSLFLHWMLFAWFAWYAFPYLGELP
jgi:hypothetical protein